MCVWRHTAKEGVLEAIISSTIRMGLFAKAILILGIAALTPLVYRQYATDNTIKFMSNYYSNYKLIDSYLRLSAGHIDHAKEYLPNSEQLQQVYEKLNKQLKQFLNPVPHNKDVLDKSTGQQDEKSASTVNRLTSCPGEEAQLRLWSKDELSNFDGSSSPEVYLGFLGIVYNVTINGQHYGPGADYNAFAGHDATRAFVTGNFTHDLHDDIKDIDEKMYLHFETWSSFYSMTYQSLGRIEGAFYDSRGCPTSELNRVNTVFAKLSEEKTKQNEQDKQLPECNTEWNGDLKKGKVWCSKKSGGVEREWAGVPRIYDDGESKKCVCLNPEAPNLAQQSENLVLYPGCETNASECWLQE